MMVEGDNDGNYYYTDVVDVAVESIEANHLLEWAVRGHELT